MTLRLPGRSNSGFGGISRVRGDPYTAFTMLRNHLAASLRNLARNRFYTLICVTCLAVGLASTFLAAAYIDHLSSYNRWITGHQHVYRVWMEYTMPGTERVELDTTPHDVAAWAALNVAGVRQSARIVVMWRRPVRQGSFETLEDIAWADESVFAVLPLPTHAGELTTALAQPDSVVLTRSAARKYFGTENVLGRTLEIDRRHTMVVRAVVEDLPPNTRITDGQGISMFAAASAQFSPMNSSGRAWSAFTHIRVDAGTTIDQLNTALARYSWEGSAKVRLRTSPLDDLGYSRDRRTLSLAMPLLAALVLLISCTNFISLATARSVGRSMEVGVRKVAGADRRHLVGQFMTEALILSAIAMVVALSLCELSLPRIRSLLDVPLTFEYVRNAPLMFVIIGITLATAVLSGFYPAVLLSRLRPASILSGGPGQTGRARGLRKALVVFQFSVLAALLVSTFVATEQVEHLMQKSLRFDGERMLVLRATCRRAFLDELGKIPGVTGAACSESAPLNFVTNKRAENRMDGTKQAFEAVLVDAGFLELYGLSPLAGRFFRADSQADLTQRDSPHARVVINATAVSRFGFESAQAAIGRNPIPGATQSFEIIGVVEDFRLGRFAESMLPMVYFAEPERAAVVSVKLRGDHLPETLRSIDELWKALGDPAPISRSFLSESIEAMHRSIMRQRWMLGAFAVLAVSLAVVGMLGLASSAAQERGLEIGVRKAFGAGTRQLVQLILWRFMRLAAIAGVIGCLVALPLLQRWLEGFADRIDLHIWMFVATFALVVGIAALAVCGHTIVMARMHPTAVLRRE